MGKTKTFITRVDSKEKDFYQMKNYAYFLKIEHTILILICI